MIQLNSLHIKSSFKNLINLFIDFEKSKAITLLIGNNGSGKSNIIEALSSVFAGLFNSDFNPIFSYELKYNKDDVPITIAYDSTKAKNRYSITLPNASFDYLPTKVISVYSGEELRLWNRYYFRFYESFMKEVISNKKRFSENQKMEFINKYYWNLALLTMVVSDLDISDIIGQRRIKSIILEYKKNNIDNIKNYTTNEVIRFADLLLSLGQEYKSDPNKRIIEIDELKSKVPETHTEFFKLFSIALLPKEDNWKLINKLEIILDNDVNTEELSEGEKKQILIKFITRIFADENSILLLDEPDSHIHIQNKAKLKTLLLDSLSNNRPYVQSILTTHSPTLTQCFENENVYMLVQKDGKVEIQDSTKQEIIYNLTNEFWSLQEQNIFHSSSNPIVLFVEGKHDKEHILNAFEKLKDEYAELNFDIFYMNSACNIPPMMTGLRTSEIDYNKIFIGIFDDDTTGNIELSKTESQFPNNQNKKRHDVGFFAFKYPKHDEHKSKVFTVENFFDSSLLETAYSLALAEFAGRFKGKSIDSISEDVKERAKTKLFENSKTLTNKEDFKNFRKLFDLIKEVHKYSFANKVAVPVVNPVSCKPTTATSTVPTPMVSAKVNHFEYWTAFKAFVELQRVSFKLQSPAPQHWTNVSIGSSDFIITILANTQNKSICVQLLCRGEKALDGFYKLKTKYEKDAIENLSPNLEWKENKGKKEQHINLVFADKNPFDKTEWNNQHQLLSDWTEKFYNYFKDKVKDIGQ